MGDFCKDIIVVVLGRGKEGFVLEWNEKEMDIWDIVRLGCLKSVINNFM